MPEKIDQDKNDQGKSDSDKIDELKKRMDELETMIRETKSRLPAHSTKPPVMMDLLDYEDEYDALLKKLNILKNK